jgi:hypothetical protein
VVLRKKKVIRFEYIRAFDNDHSLTEWCFFTQQSSVNEIGKMSQIDSKTDEYRGTVGKCGV